MGEDDSVEDLDQGVTSRWGRCFTAVFGIPFGPGALPILRALKAL
jgi:hypothetical protein